MGSFIIRFSVIQNENMTHNFLTKVGNFGHSGCAKPKNREKAILN